MKLAILAAAAALSFPPLISTAFAQVQTGALHELGQATTIVQGRAVSVDTDLVRDSSTGELVLEVRLSTLDRRGLPAISFVSARVVNADGRAWRPSLLVFPSTTGSALYGADNGPSWRPGDWTRAIVNIRAGGRAWQVTIPITVGEA